MQICAKQSTMYLIWLLDGEVDMCVPQITESEPVETLFENIGEAVGLYNPREGDKSGFTNVGPEKEKEPPKAPQLDPEQMAKVRAAGDDERRRALLRIGRSSTKKTGSLGLPGDPFTATRKLLGG